MKTKTLSELKQYIDELAERHTLTRDAYAALLSHRTRELTDYA